MSPYRMKMLYEEGLSMPEIAAMVPCGKNTVKRHLMRLGVQIRGRSEAGRLARRKSNWSLQLERRLLDLLGNDLGYAEIGRELGFSRHAIKSKVNRIRRDACAS